MIGINEQIATAPSGGSSGSIGLGFAVPINTAVASMKQLEIGKPSAWLGASGVSVTPQVAQAFKLPIQSAAEVAAVVPGSPAEKAGLRGATSTATISGQPYPIGGDIITAFDGQKVTGMQQLQKMIAGHRPGDRVTLTVWRDGKTRQGR